MGDLEQILKFDPEKNVPDDIVADDIINDIIKFDPDTSEPEKEIPREKKEADTWSEAIRSSVNNFPEDTINLVSGMVDAMLSPVETGKSLGYLAQGIAQKSIPGKQPQEDFADYFANTLKEKYGSADGLKQQIAQHPAETLADIATVLYPAGKLSGVKKVAEVGASLEPINATARVASLPLKLLPEKVPNNLYKSAVKFGTTISDKERTMVTRTALKSQIMPTEKGLRKLRDLINTYNEKVNEHINNVAEKGFKIDVDTLFLDLEKLKNQFKLTSDNPLEWDRAFKTLKKNWEEMYKQRAVRTPKEVQKIKTNIYRDLESFYEKHKATPAKVELRKAVARNARQMLENLIPEIKQLNKEEGALIELWDALESKANRITNRDLIGIGIPVKMGTGAGVGYMFGGEVGGAVGSQIGLALGIFDVPQVKSKLALVVNRLREDGINISNWRTLSRLGLVQMERVRENWSGWSSENQGE